MAGPLLHVQGHEEKYTYYLTSDDVAEITSAVAKVKAKGVSTEQDILKVQASYGLLRAQCNQVPDDCSIL